MKRFTLVLLVMVMIFVVPACKKNDEFNIVGSWEFAVTFVENQQTETEKYMAEFEGTATEGTWTMNLDETGFIKGTYKVTGDTVEMKITYANYEDGITGTFTGKFESEDKMSGNWSVADNGNHNTGTWTAIRK